MSPLFAHGVRAFTSRVSVPHPHPTSKAAPVFAECVPGGNRRGDWEGRKLVFLQKRICLRHGLRIHLTPLRERPIELRTGFFDGSESRIRWPRISALHHEHGPREVWMHRTNS